MIHTWHNAHDQEMSFVLDGHRYWLPVGGEIDGTDDMKVEIEKTGVLLTLGKSPVQPPPSFKRIEARFQHSKPHLDAMNRKAALPVEQQYVKRTVPVVRDDSYATIEQEIQSDEELANSKEPKQASNGKMNPAIEAAVRKLAEDGVSLPGVTTEASERIWMNLPPARVWVYRKG